MNPFDINWFMLALWFSMMIISYFSKLKYLTTISSLLGIIFGIIIIPESSLLSLVLIFLNIYVLYDSIFGEKSK